MTTQPTNNKVTGMTVRLPAELADALKNYAFVTGTSANDVIKQALIDYLKAHARTDMVRTAFEKVLEQHSVAFDKLEYL
ncbi:MULTISPECIES: CopG family ribbon-helix-helix protein [unclassified Mycobacterium]|uniref:CopG family ribbon-helix-helix protein n=1 Tax=unclassified Mycobacterium TaxID=2642494 RepID=UPI0007FC14D8|nr:MULTISPECIES: ribbon-helix-helix protein, CopG family [unclassified Mycobacterium]OBG75341.1 DNA-binding protein [Mycobacterium sp. E1214]OBH31597.1 DNA-binding protein [Mycobacterium sp. E1319]